MGKTKMTAAERRKYRQDNYRAEIKRENQPDFLVISSGKKIDDNPKRNIAALESIRLLVYPELSQGMSMDRSIVKIIRGHSHED